MNPFSKRLTRQERSAIWNNCDPLLTHLLAVSEEDFLAGADDAVSEVEIVPARPLTVVEKTQLDNELARTTLFNGAYAPREYSPIPAIAALQKAEEKANLEKLLGHQPRVESPIDQMISKAVEEAIAKLPKHHPPSERERESLVIRSGSSTHLTKSGGRIEVDGNECTEYRADGGLLGSWIGTPSDRPQFESRGVR